LYAGRPLDAADATSIPIPSRFVTFAAVFGESLTREIASLKPSLIVHGTFAVAAMVVARNLGLPRVAICSGHNQSPRNAIPPLSHDPRVAVSTACREAVDVLRNRYGITNASPFSYFDSLSETLNIVPEPKDFLLPEEAADFAPCEFFGCVDPNRFRGLQPSETANKAGEKRIYVSFGTHSHRYYAEVIERAFAKIIEAAAGMPERSFTLTLGGARIALPRRIPANVSIQDFVDQPGSLANADIYLTHHGSNSTHESVYLRKPMISYPLFADQPGMARRCQEFGFAIPLVSEPRSSFEPPDVVRAIRDIESHHETMLGALAKGRQWEESVINARPAVIAKILACA
jgi:UDP:flavonoid glycosyltransferase YjiC (YdhE family)